MSGTTTYIERMLPNAVNFKQFYGGYGGTCGETALASAMVCSTAKIESKQEAIDLMLSLTAELIGLGWAGKSGATTTRNLYSAAVRRGFTPYNVPFKASNGETHPTFIGYQEPLYMDWLHELLLDQAGVRPITLELAKGRNLIALNGGRDGANLDYHFITVVGINKDGYVCEDGDNSEIEKHLVVYPWSVLKAAVPCGVLILEMQEAFPMLTIEQAKGYFTANADGSLWTCKNGRTLRGSILAHYRNLPAKLGGLTYPGLPVTEELPVFPGESNPDKAAIRIQVFERGAVAYDKKRLLDNPPGAEGDCYFVHLNHPLVKAVFYTPTPPAQPAPTPLSEQQKSDLAVMAALRASLKAS